MLNGYGPALARLWPYSCADFEGDEVPPFCWASCIAHTRVLLKCLSALDLRNAWNLSTNPPTKLQITATPSIIINMRMARIFTVRDMQSWINMNQHLRWPHVFTSQSPQRCVNSREHKRCLVLPAFFLFTQAFWMKSFSKCGVRQPQRASSFQALSSINWSPKSISGLSLELLWSSRWKQKHLSGSHLGHIWYHLLSAHPIIRNIEA